jgi:hypothetical protein
MQLTNSRQTALNGHQLAGVDDLLNSILFTVPTASIIDEDDDLEDDDDLGDDELDLDDEAEASGVVTDDVDADVDAADLDDEDLDLDDDDDDEEDEL